MQPAPTEDDTQVGTTAEHALPPSRATTCLEAPEQQVVMLCKSLAFVKAVGVAALARAGLSGPDGPPPGQTAAAKAEEAPVLLGRNPAVPIAGETELLGRKSGALTLRPAAEHADTVSARPNVQKLEP